MDKKLPTLHFLFGDIVYLMKKEKSMMHQFFEWFN